MSEVRTCMFRKRDVSFASFLNRCDPKPTIYLIKIVDLRGTISLNLVRKVDNLPQAKISKTYGFSTRYD